MTGKSRFLLAVAVVLVLLPVTALAQPGDAQDVAAQKEKTDSADTAEPSSPGYSDEVLAQLGRDQLYELLREKQFFEAGKGVSRHRIDLVGILVPSILFVCLAVAVAFALAYRARKDRQMHETLRLMVEKGADIPKELLTPPPRKNVDLRRGILLLAAGIGFMLFMALIGLWEPEALRGLGVGAIPIFIGIGYLVVWRLSKKHVGEK